MEHGPHPLFGRCVYATRACSAGDVLLREPALLQAASPATCPLLSQVLSLLRAGTAAPTSGLNEAASGASCASGGKLPAGATDSDLQLSAAQFVAFCLAPPSVQSEVLRCGLVPGMPTPTCVSWLPLGRARQSDVPKDAPSLQD
jgi:hypothetical protein